jgi:hypothetical protein
VDVENNEVFDINKIVSELKSPFAKVNKETVIKNDKEYKKETPAELAKSEPRIHTSWLEDYCDYTQYQESPRIFHLWVGLSTIAAVLNRNVYLQKGYDKLYPNLYTVLVSPTGKSKKTTSAKIGIFNFLNKVDNIRLLSPKTTPEGLITYLNMAPVIKIGTNTYDKQCTACLFAPELAAMLSNQSYVSTLTTVMTDFWDCPDIWDDNTRTSLLKKDTIKLNDVCLNFLGCSTPEWLAKGLQEDSFGGGFMGRVIFVYSTKTNKTRESAWNEVPPEIKARGLTLLRDLQQMGKLRGAFKVEKEAYEFFIGLYLSHLGDFTGRMAGYFERKLTYALKLSMILSASLSNSMMISKSNITDAIKLLEEVEQEMAGAFVYINATNEAKIAQHILNLLIEYGGIATRKTLYKRIRHMIRNNREFDDIMEGLAESDLIRKGILGVERGYSLIKKEKGDAKCGE